MGCRGWLMEGRLAVALVITVTVHQVDFHTQVQQVAQELEVLVSDEIASREHGYG